VKEYVRISNYRPKKINSLKKRSIIAIGQPFIKHELDLQSVPDRLIDPRVLDLAVLKDTNEARPLLLEDRGVQEVRFVIVGALRHLLEENEGMKVHLQADPAGVALAPEVALGVRQGHVQGIDVVLLIEGDARVLPIVAEDLDRVREQGEKSLGRRTGNDKDLDRKRDPNVTDLGLAIDQDVKSRVHPRIAKIGRVDHRNQSQSL
jgi:hypothetical protein